MPTYTFLNTETNEEFEQMMSMSQREDFLRENLHIKQTIRKTPGILGHRDSAIRADGKIRDVLQNVKNNFPGTNAFDSCL